MPEMKLPFDCPRCGEPIPDGDYDEATIGQFDFGQDFYRHFQCPNCGQCVGCIDEDEFVLSNQTDKEPD